MNALVTGGTGFIGSALVRSLLTSGAVVRILSLPGTEGSLPRHERLQFFAGTVTDPGSVRRSMDGCDQVYHLAALACPWCPSPDDYFHVNCVGTDIVLRTALDVGVQRVLHVSSNVVFGPSNDGCADEDTPRSVDYDTTYERSKVAAERVVQSYVRRGLDAVIVNPTRVFGPGPLTESNAVTQMIGWYLQGTWRWILGDGRSVGNYVYLPDLVLGMQQVMERGRTGHNYLLGGENVTFNELFSMLAAVSGIRHKLFHLPPSAAFIFARFEGMRAGLFGKRPLITSDWTRTFLRQWPNTTRKAQDEVCYRPTPFEDALRQTADWILHQAGEPSRDATPAVARS